MSNLIVDKYMLKQELATFDTGTVLYRAEDIVNGALYSIKAFNGGQNSDAAKLRDYFYAEAKILPT